MIQVEHEALALARELRSTTPDVTPTARRAWQRALDEAEAALMGLGGLRSRVRRALRLPGLAAALPANALLRALRDRLLARAERASPPRLLPDGAPGPRVSFVIPCYNQSAFLADALASCRAAHDGPIEIVIVDDGSTEPGAAAAIAAACAATGVEATVVRTANRGLADARNSGLQATTGEFVQFLDADDLLVPGKVTRQLAHMHDDAGIDVSVCDHFVVDGSRTRCAPRDSMPPGPSPALEDFLLRWERGLSIPIHTALFRRRALGPGPTFPQGCRAKEDWIFWTDLAARGARIGYLPMPLAAYRVHGSNMTRGTTSGLRWLAATATLAKRHPAHADAVMREGIRWFRRFYLPLLGPPARPLTGPEAAAFSPAGWRDHVEAARTRQTAIAATRRAGRGAPDAARLAAAALTALADAPAPNAADCGAWRLAPVACEPALALPQCRLADGLSACLVAATLSADSIEAVRRSVGMFDLVLCESPQVWLALLGYVPDAGSLRLVDAPLHA